jgi:hypothetical protein
MILDAVRQEELLRVLNKTLGGSFGVVQHRTLGGGFTPGKKGASGAALLCLPELLKATEEGPAGFLLRFAPGQTGPEDAELRNSLSQTWQWDGARESVLGAPFRVILSETHTLHLEPRERVGLLQLALQAATSLLLPAALHFPVSQCLIDPASYRENLPDSPDYLSVHGWVNNRIFTAEGEKGPVLMDTLGLHLLGLPDVQCPLPQGFPDYADLSFWLYNLAEYMCEHPGLPAEGDTLIGPDGSEWEVRSGPSLLPPERLVLDLRMPAPSGGRR